MTSIEVNGVEFIARGEEFSDMVRDLAADIFDALGIDTEYDEELDVDTEDIFEEFRYDVLEDEVLCAIQDAINEVKLDFTDKYKDELLRLVKDNANNR